MRTLLLHKACLPLTSHITMSGLGTGIPVYSRLSISIRISQSELNGDRGLTDPQHSTLTRWQVARRLGSNCVTTVTLLHFNDLFDHHLPGPCGSARGSTLGPGTGLRLAEKTNTHKPHDSLFCCSVNVERFSFYSKVLFLPC